MLQKVDTQTKRLMALADSIEHSDTFNMRQWCDCIAGHAVRLFLDQRYVVDTKEAARTALRLTERQATDLFQRRDSCRREPAVRELSRNEAARAVRHLAVTGEVRFS